MHIPYSAIELIEELERLFPEKTPRVEEIADPIRLSFQAGKRDLIRNLRANYEQQLQEEAEEDRLKGEFKDVS